MPGNGLTQIDCGRMEQSWCKMLQPLGNMGINASVLPVPRGQALPPQIWSGIKVSGSLRQRRDGGAHLHHKSHSTTHRWCTPPCDRVSVTRASRHGVAREPVVGTEPIWCTEAIDSHRITVTVHIAVCGRRAVRTATRLVIAYIQLHAPAPVQAGPPNSLKARPIVTNTSSEAR